MADAEAVRQGRGLELVETEVRQTELVRQVEADGVATAEHQQTLVAAVAEVLAAKVVTVLAAPEAEAVELLEMATLMVSEAQV